MGKTNKYSKNQQQARSAVAAPSSPASGPASQTQALTAEQIQDVEVLTYRAKAISPETPPAEAPQPTMSPAQAITSAWDAERTFRTAERDANRLQDAAKARGRELQKERDDLGRREAELLTRTAELGEREKKLLDQDVRLGERERNAELGFLDERRRAVEAWHTEDTALRESLLSLAADADARRSAEDIAWRQRLDERAESWRREDGVRGERWLREDAGRAQEVERERRRLAEELTQERERERTARAKEDAEHAARMKADEQALEALRTRLAEEQRGLRRQGAELATEREMLDEDRKAQEARVTRLANARVAEVSAQLLATGAQLERVKAERDRLWTDLESRRDLDRRFGDEHPEQVLGRLQQLERESADLRVQLRARPTEVAALRLAELEKERSAWLEAQAVLGQKLAQAEAWAGRQRVAAIEVETLRSKTEALETNKRLLEAAVNELGAQVEKYTQADEKKNPMAALLALDQRPDLKVPQRTSGPLDGGLATLADFAADLRHRLAVGVKGRTLHYTPRDVRCFLGGLAMTRLILLQGISGTGKTSLPDAFAAATGAGHRVVEVQAGWRDRQDLIGYYNAFHRQYYVTNFLQALYTAGTPAFRDRLFLIVLDEINLSRVEQFFADFLSALEQPEHKRQLTLLPDSLPVAPALMVEGQHLPIPPNVWFVGTANHDETTTEFADKTYDRAHVMELPRRDPVRDAFAVKPSRPREALSYPGLVGAFEAARLTHAAEVKKVLMWLSAKDGIADLLDRRFKVGWGNRLERDVENFIPVVVAAGGNAGEGLDHLLATKVLRKLKDRHDVRPAGLDDLRKLLLGSWGDMGDPPERSIGLIDREIRAKRDEDVGA